MDNRSLWERICEAVCSDATNQLLRERGLGCQWFQHDSIDDILSEDRGADGVIADAVYRVMHNA